MIAFYSLLYSIKSLFTKSKLYNCEQLVKSKCLLDYFFVFRYTAFILQFPMGAIEREVSLLESTRSLTETQEKIARAAFSLFAQNGFKATTTKEIAKASGVNESTLFKNFSNKLEIFEIAKKEESLIFENQLIELFEKPYENLSSLINEGGRSLFYLFLVHRDLISIFFRELDNKELSIGRNTVFETSTNQLIKAISRITNLSSDRYCAPAFQLVSSLICLSLNEANGGVLTDELELPVSVEDLCHTTATFLTNQTNS